ncbi:TetR/AcrR family transcriptional regulator [Halanaeroarchaeum sulfurireducens]|uniref:TetR family transcriptional regulator n=1 Tax=Halanaeroarchaeum sulfurireducens TaxID=1604004 RepID=A0A0F7PG26_9EURY|nr:TetR/AcrR family transcriptional regulator [Halanaeroarchaeum sulfurireducens]AKH98529.1 TetR family transcriptional regulator [Halanaeroarchaeum sulfurireducens]ALG82971.1 TetR family transcriptional regulator [Halanaeroarchaeum sulfurireducens]
MKGFSDAERERIRADLIEAGRRLFTDLGLERTRISDLTDAVGIGTSTFYQFFDSKGALYLAVLHHESERIVEDYERKLADAPTLEAEVRLGLASLFEELENNQLFYRSIVENERQVLLRRLPAERQQERYRETNETLVALAERWTGRPRFRADDPETVVGLIRMLTQVVRLREEFKTLDTETEYGQARDLLIDVLVAGLVKADEASST